MPIWKDSRIAAGLTQSAAAQQLYISAPQLSKLEAGRIPDADLILRMAALYHDPKLISRYCADICPFHRDDGLQNADLSDVRATCDAVAASVTALQHLGTRLAAILEDGEIDCEEQTTLEAMRPTLQRVSQEANELKLWACHDGVPLPVDGKSAAALAAATGRTSEAGAYYARLRRKAGWSNYHEAAAAAGMDRDRLSRIENSQITPRPEEILTLSALYHTPELPAYYCARQCPIGMQHRPVSDNTAHISLAMLSSLYHISFILDDLRHLLADGQITPDESAGWSTLVNRLNSLIFASDSLLAFLDRSTSDK